MVEFILGGLLFFLWAFCLVTFIGVVGWVVYTVALWLGIEIGGGEDE
jgi:hypothetical protein